VTIRPVPGEATNSATRRGDACGEASTQSARRCAAMATARRTGCCSAEDLRSDPAAHRHGLCFARVAGVEALLPLSPVDVGSSDHRRVGRDRVSSPGAAERGLPGCFSRPVAARTGRIQRRPAAGPAGPARHGKAPRGPGPAPRTIAACCSVRHVSVPAVASKEGSTTLTIRPYG